MPITNGKRSARRSGYATVWQGTKPCKSHLNRTKESYVPALLVVLLIIVLLALLGLLASALKVLLYIALILAIIWLIGFFVRGSEGARWYRW
jgi:fatty acid desaturase